MGLPQPLFRLFSSISNNQYKFYSKLIWKMSIQYPVAGFKLTTFWLGVSSYHHKTSPPTTFIRKTDISTKRRRRRRLTVGPVRQKVVSSILGKNLNVALGWFSPLLCVHFGLQTCRANLGTGAVMWWFGTGISLLISLSLTLSLSDTAAPSHIDVHSLPLSVEFLQSIYIHPHGTL